MYQSTGFAGKRISGRDDEEYLYDCCSSSRSVRIREERKGCVEIPRCFGQRKGEVEKLKALLRDDIGWNACHSLFNERSWWRGTWILQKSYTNSLSWSILER